MVFTPGTQIYTSQRPRRDIDYESLPANNYFSDRGDDTALMTHLFNPFTTGAEGSPYMFPTIPHLRVASLYVCIFIVIIQDYCISVSQFDVR